MAFCQAATEMRHSVPRRPAVHRVNSTKSGSIGAERLWISSLLREATHLQNRSGALPVCLLVTFAHFKLRWHAKIQWLT